MALAAVYEDPVNFAVGFSADSSIAKARPRAVSRAVSAMALGAVQTVLFRAFADGGRARRERILLRARSRGHP